ncbi:MAG: hypothetical protein IJX26_00570 [Clostridia bacterium]|nr:hypothetical protein [Clostridia bacterium]
MKKFLKLLVCVFSVMIGCGMALANPAINVVSAIEAINDAISVTNAAGSFAFKAVKMPTSVDAETDTEKTGFFIPVPAVSNTSAEVKINVSDGKNTYTHEVNEADTAYFKAATVNSVSGFYFKYNASTTYDVYFTAEIGGAIYSSSIYEVKVNGVSYSFNTENSKVIPSIAGLGDKMLIPEISVINSKDIVMDDAGITTKVIKNGDELAVSNNGELRVQDGKTYLIPSAEGTYTIRYNSVKYNLSKEYEINVTESFDSSKVKLEAKTLTMKEVEVGKEISFPKAQVKDSYHKLDNIATTTTITVVDENGVEDPLDADVYNYTFTKAGSYTVKYQIRTFYLNADNEEIVKPLNIQISEDVVVNDTIAPVVSFAGDYDATKLDEESYEVSVLGDYAVPTKVGYNGVTLPALYAEDLGTKYSNMTFQRVLVSNSGTEYDIDSIEDNASLASDYEKDVTKAVKFSFKKEDNETDEEFITRVSGTYTLIYRATETVGVNETKRTGTKSVSIRFLSVDAGSYTDDTKLSISLPTISSDMKADEVKTVTVPNPSDDSDTSIETHYYYYYGAETLFKTAFDAEKVTDKNYAYDFETFKDSFNTANGTLDGDNNPVDALHELTVQGGKLSIDLSNSEYDGQRLITVVAVAINDQGQFVVDLEEVNIKDDITDIEAPSVSSATAFAQTTYILGQQEQVDLPDVVFSDVIDKKLSIDVKYYVDKPENGLKPVNGGSIAYVADTAIVTGGYINATQAGTYYVVYTAKDDANNSYDFVTSFKVEKEVVYSVKVECDSAVDIYGSIEINAYVEDDEGNRHDDIPVDINFTGLMPKGEDTTYTFDYAGDYSFVASAEVDGKTITSGKISIKVNDVKFVWNNESAIPEKIVENLSPSKEYELLTNKPSDWETNYTSYYTLETGNYVAVPTADPIPDFETSTYYKKNELIYVQLTVPTANQNGRNRVADVKVVDPNGDDVELIDVIVDGVKTGDVKFLASKEGQYKATYSVGSGDNAASSKTTIIQVGDNNSPVIKISNKSKLQEEIVYNNKDLTYKLTYKLNSSKTSSKQNVYTITVTVSEGNEKLHSYDTELALYDIDRNGNQVALSWANAIKNSSIKLNGSASESSSEYIWTIKSLDDYELTISATDSYGNVSTTEKINFSVVDEAAAKTKKDNKVGIILIVISIIILAGIVCFFGFSGKASGFKSKKNKSVEIKEENNDKENQ